MSPARQEAGAAPFPARIRLGMVGGGKDAFIGNVHRIAARIDGRFELVAGALSSTPERARESGRLIGLDRDRIYDDFAQMAERESARADGIEAVAIVTPNHLHVAAACAFLERNIHVICDKPLAAQLEDARRLARLARNSGALFVLTHNYTGYPLIREARHMVQAGVLGKIRLVQSEYVQDWLARPIELEGQKQAGWRTDPAQAGGGGALGDIGTHAIHLSCFVSGLAVRAVSADLMSFVPQRRLDDNGHILLRFDEGARGMLWFSQIAIGCENGLRLRVVGENGALDWSQEEPNKMWHAPFGAPRRLITRGAPGLSPSAGRMTRIPPGHPEGYLEGFANIYGEAAEAILARRGGTDTPGEVLFPTIEDGLAGMAFIDAALRSSRADGAWTPLESTQPEAGGGTAGSA